MDHKKKFYLFKQSQNFCSVPWNYFKIDTDGSVKTCVKGLTDLGNINQQSIQDILKNPQLIQIKKDMYNDVPNSNCIGCRTFEQESNNYKFLRQLYNDYFLKVDIDYSDPNAFVLSGVDLHWDSTCNLKCVTCWEKQSSAIAQEMRLPILTTTEKDVADVTNWIASNQHSIREIYLSGGEPTLMKKNLRLLESLDKNGNFLLRVNTNLTFSHNNKIIHEILKFPNVLITVSADALNDRFEYIRHGANWDQFISNLDWLASTHVGLRINSVFFVASALRLIETQNFFRQRYNINDFTINQCGMEKYSLMSRNLPNNIKQELQEKFQQAIITHAQDTNLVGQLTNCIKEMQFDHNGHSYSEYFDSIDYRRKTNWKAVFPELIP
jgi:radical SAM protein with 4Fe4S-binding SPASM domain